MRPGFYGLRAWVWLRIRGSGFRNLGSGMLLILGAVLGEERCSFPEGGAGNGLLPARVLWVQALGLKGSSRLVLGGLVYSTGTQPFSEAEQMQTG